MGKDYCGSGRVLLVCRVGAYLGIWVLAWPLMEQGASIGGVEDNLKNRYRGKTSTCKNSGIVLKEEIIMLLEYEV